MMAFISLLMFSLNILSFYGIFFLDGWMSFWCWSEFYPPQKPYFHMMMVSTKKKIYYHRISVTSIVVFLFYIFFVLFAFHFAHHFLIFWFFSKQNFSFSLKCQPLFDCFVFSLTPKCKTAAKKKPEKTEKPETNSAKYAGIKTCTFPWEIFQFSWLESILFWKAKRKKPENK